MVPIFLLDFCFFNAVSLLCFKTLMKAFHMYVLFLFLRDVDLLPNFQNLSSMIHYRDKVIKKEHIERK